MALADRGLGANALAGFQRGLEQPVGERPGGLLDERGLVRALDLALDLGLADDHRLEPGGDPVEMSSCIAVAVRVDRRGERRGADARLAREHREDRALRLDRLPYH